MIFKFLKFNKKGNITKNKERSSKIDLIPSFSIDHLEKGKGAHYLRLKETIGTELDGFILCHWLRTGLYSTGVPDWMCQAYSDFPFGMMTRNLRPVRHFHDLAIHSCIPPSKFESIDEIPKPNDFFRGYYETRHQFFKD